MAKMLILLALLAGPALAHSHGGHSGGSHHVRGHLTNHGTSYVPPHTAHNPR